MFYQSEIFTHNHMEWCVVPEKVSHHTTDFALTAANIKGFHRIYTEEHHECEVRQYLHAISPYWAKMENY